MVGRPVSEKSVRWTFAVQSKALLKTVLISLMSSLFCCLNARWWPSGISTAILVSLMSSAHEGCCCFSSRRVEYLWFFLPSYLCGDKGRAQTLLSIPPTQQPVLALCRWPESPQDWQTDKARNLYPALGEELTAAISPMFLLQGGNCQALTRRADHLQRKKKKEFSTTEFVMCRLWVSVSYLWGLLPETKTRSGVYVRIAPLQVTLSRHATTRFFVGGSSKSGASVLEMKTGR